MGAALLVAALVLAVPAAANAQEFSDVPPGAFFTPAVAWMAATGLTTGVGGSDRFEPNRATTRGEFITFLWRNAGSPGPHGPHGFVDVPAGAFFERPVGWARAERLTTGVGGSNRFEPHAIVSRAEAITFLWRNAGSPRPFPHHRFVDVPAGSYYAEAVRWAAATGVTTGVGGTNRFDPDGDVTRGQLATLLWRIEGQPPPVPLRAFETVSAGDRHSCGVTGDGFAWCWGSQSGLGHGSSSHSSTPVQVRGLRDVVAISAGADFSCAVTGNGAAWCWGSNRLGDGTTSSSNVPVRVHGGEQGGQFLTGVTDISAGTDHACAVTGNGAAWCWGNDGSGALGQGSKANRTAPARVRGVGGTGTLNDVRAISAGSRRTCAVTGGGAAWCWGSGRLGDGTQTLTSSSSPVRVLGAGGAGTLNDVRAISAGATHACAVTGNGAAWCWGGVGGPLLGDGTTDWSNVPVRVHGGEQGGQFLSGATDISAGHVGSCAVTGDGAAWCWGTNPLGHGSTGSSTTPVRVRGPGGTGTLNNVRDISVGAPIPSGHACAATGDGAAWCWGSGSRGQLGNGSSQGSSSPVRVG